MNNIKEHVNRHARRIVRAGKYVHRKLHSPVHPFIGWWVVTVVSMSSFLIISGAFAQTGSSTLFSNEQPPPAAPAPGTNLAPIAPAQPLPPFSGDATGTPPLPNQPIAPCAPGTRCPNPPPPAGSPEGAPQSPNQGPGQQGPGQQMDRQRFEMMKKSLNQFTKEVARIKSQINALQKKGITVPAELSQAIAQMDGLAAKIKDAQNADDFEGSLNDFQDAANTIREWMPKLGRMAQMPQMFKQAGREISRAEKAYAGDVKRAKSAKMDLSDSLEEFRKAIDGQKDVLDQAKQLSGSDPETAMDNLQDEFFGNLDNMWEKERVIQMALNIRQGISQMTREMKDADKLIKKLKAKKQDTGELEQLLAQSRAEFEQLKVLAAAKPIDPESLMAQIEKMMDIKQEFGDKVQELTGDTGYAMPQQQNQNFQFNMPSGFMMQGPGGPDSQGGGFGQQPGQMMPQQGQSQPN